MAPKISCKDTRCKRATTEYPDTVWEAENKITKWYRWRTYPVWCADAECFNGRHCWALPAITFGVPMFIFKAFPATLDKVYLSFQSTFFLSFALPLFVFAILLIGPIWVAALSPIFQAYSQDMIRRDLKGSHCFITSQLVKPANFPVSNCCCAFWLPYLQGLAPRASRLREISLLRNSQVWERWLPNEEKG